MRDSRVDGAVRHMVDTRGLRGQGRHHFGHGREGVEEGRVEQWGRQGARR